MRLSPGHEGPLKTTSQKNSYLYVTNIHFYVELITRAHENGTLTPSSTLYLL